MEVMTNVEGKQFTFIKILFVVDSIYTWKSGIWFHRNHLPSMGLKSRGHACRFVVLLDQMSKELLEWPDVVIFGRTYGQRKKPVKVMQQFKERGVRVLYDIDDDLWTVNPENPSVFVSNAYKDQYEGMIRECDAVITPSPILAKKIQKLCKKKVFPAPNMIHTQYYKERPHQEKRLMIGYTGASSHWKDLAIIIEPLQKLQKKHDFFFTLQGMVAAPLEGEMYVYSEILKQNLQPEKKAYIEAALEWYQELKDIEMQHIPFYPPALYPTVLSKADIDIGLAPLIENEFNSGKSNIKYYEYASVGTCCLASDVEPYKQEVNYRAKNTTDDWVNKLERLIVDEKFRKELTDKQRDWVLKNRNVYQVAVDWEIACQRPGGLKVLNQQR
jgi:glycosyltransferase involved in cell wall biosynthesis